MIPSEGCAWRMTDSREDAGDGLAFRKNGEGTILTIVQHRLAVDADGLVDGGRDIGGRVSGAARMSALLFREQMPFIAGYAVERWNLSTSLFLLAAGGGRLRSGDRVNLSGGEIHQGIGPQTEQFRPSNPVRESAAEVCRTDAGDAHQQRLAQGGAAEEGQANVIADPEAADVLMQLHVINAFTPAEFIDVLDLNSDEHGSSFPLAARSAREVARGGQRCVSLCMRDVCRIQKAGLEEEGIKNAKPSHIVKIDGETATRQSAIGTRLSAIGLQDCR